jgi:NO-binding membrane sensor protein with MHYT domain
MIPDSASSAVSTITMIVGIILLFYIGTAAIRLMRNPTGKSVGQDWLILALSVMGAFLILGFAASLALGTATNPLLPLWNWITR